MFRPHGAPDPPQVPQLGDLIGAMFRPRCRPRSRCRPPRTEHSGRAFSTLRPRRRSPQNTKARWAKGGKRNSDPHELNGAMFRPDRAQDPPNIGQHLADSNRAMFLPRAPSGPGCHPPRTEHGRQLGSVLIGAMFPTEGIRMPCNSPWSNGSARCSERAGCVGQPHAPYFAPCPFTHIRPRRSTRCAPPAGWRRACWR